MRYSVALLNVEHMLYTLMGENTLKQRIFWTRQLHLDELRIIHRPPKFTTHDHAREAGDASSRGAWLCRVVCMIFRGVAALEPPVLVARFSS